VLFVVGQHSTLGEASKKKKKSHFFSVSQMSNITLNVTGGDMCDSMYLQDVVFPWASGVLFGLLSVTSLSALVLVLIRRHQINHAWIRALFFSLLGIASGLHVGIGLVHALLTIAAADTIYNQLQNSYFLTLTIAVNVVNVLLLIPAPKSSGWTRVGIVAVGLSLCGVCVHFGFVLGKPELWNMRIAWVVTDGCALVALICCIQAGARARSHIREIALLTAAAAAFVLRYVVSGRSRETNKSLKWFFFFSLA
jgi:hypothetical protein